MAFQKSKRWCRATFAMVIKNTIVLILLLVSYLATAQEIININILAGSITGQDLRKHLEIIAHDSLEGRETGQIGQRKAAQYIRSQFEKLGIKPVTIQGQKTYFQRFQLFRKRQGETSITVQGVCYENMKDILYIRTDSGGAEKNIDVVFAGNGDPEDYQQIEHKGKGVVLFYPAGKNGRDEKITTALEAGAEDIFFIYGTSDENIREQIRLFNNYFRHSSLDFKEDTSGNKGHVFYIPPSLAETLFGKSMKSLRKAVDKSSKGRYSSMRKIPGGNLSYKVENFEEVVETENVLGFVEGQERPDEVVVITAHYDHVGIINNEIYNGADDNGSGTCAVLEIAEAFSLAKENGLGPKKSVLFILFTGEEKGLLGSKYYTENPVFPLDKTSGDFNIDMIGRIDNKYVDNPDYVYLIGDDKISRELHEISERVNDTYVGIPIDYTYNSDSDPNRFYYRSDHYNFAKNGIPTIFYFTGVHNDYHKPTDEVDKILFDRMERICRLVFYTAWEVANMDRELLKN